MTGFASSTTESGRYSLVWEVRSVNHRFLDVNFRLPEELRAAEAACRERVASRLARGKVDATLRLTAAADARPASVLSVARLDELRLLSDQIRERLPGTQPMSVTEVLRWPGVIEEPPPDIAALDEAVRRGLDQALEGLQQTRRREGERTATALTERAIAISALLSRIRPRLDGAEEQHRARLRERLHRLGIDADPERLEQELALIAQRLDVSEEIERLAGHVEELRLVLERDEPVGRRLDFLIQELNREANTFASKVQDEELTRAAVDLKVLIEQMREQVQNLE